MKNDEIKEIKENKNEEINDKNLNSLIFELKINEELNKDQFENNNGNPNKLINSIKENISYSNALINI